MGPSTTDKQISLLFSRKFRSFALDSSSMGPICLFQLYANMRDTWALCSGLNALASILVYLLVPSTAKPKLEEMNYICKFSSILVHSSLSPLGIEPGLYQL